MGFETLLPVLKEALQIPGLLKEIYTDAAKPGVSQVGKALGTVLGLGNTILLPIHLLNERSRLVIEKNLEKYRMSLQDVPEAEIVPVRPEVGVPIVEKLTYVSDDELSDLYINLLSKASTVQTAGLAHPSFVHIINCLSPDEAILLKAVRAKKRVPFVETRLQKARVTTNLHIILQPDTWTVIKDLCTGLEGEFKFSFGENVEAYISNLSGHGILDIRRDVHVADLSVYQKLEDDLRAEAEQLEWYKTKAEDVELAFGRGKIEITPFGELFWKLA
jgi:hypothetical protein